MKLRPRQLVLLCGLVPTFLAALLCLYRPLALLNLEYAAYDTVLRSASVHQPSGRVVIVDIDEYSLTAIGQWPWRRDLIGLLLARLRDAGAAVVAFDIIFAESDRYQGPRDNPDAAFATSLRGGRAILGYALTFDRKPDGASACVQHPLGLAIVRRGDGNEPPFFQASGAVCSLELLTQSANASGFLNARPDSDGLMRRMPLVSELDGQVYPALALAAFVDATNTRDVALEVENVNSSKLTLDGRAVPLDGKANLLLRYRGPKGSFPYIPASDVLSGKALASAFTGKLVFIGTTALGTREVVATPLDTLFAGVEVQATVADNLLQQDFIRRHEHSVALETQALLGLGLIAAILVGRFGLAWGAFGVLGCIVATWTGAISLISVNGMYLSPLYPTIGLVSALATMTVAAFTIEQRRADHAGHQRTASQRLMVQTLLSLTEVRDAETGRHSRRTQYYTRVLARELARHPKFSSYLTPERIELLASLAPLHDIGKVGVPDRLLNKPGMLTAEEFEEMRKHPEHGRDVILNAEKRAGVHDDELLAMVKDIAYTHHEKWDGTGYPQGLRGAQIPIAGRIMALVDVYDAVITRRHYHTPMSHDDAVALIVAGSGTHFDPAVVAAFEKVSAAIRKLSDEGDGSEA
jgi:HD-GYP domain-containing protein (c-di-GMP phosphodiesterase class II)